MPSNSGATRPEVMSTVTAYVSSPSRTWSYTPTGSALAISCVWSGAAGTLPATLPTVTHEPSPSRSMSVDEGNVVAVRPPATTTSVPLVGCRRGATHQTTT